MNHVGTCDIFNLTKKDKSSLLKINRHNTEFNPDDEYYFKIEGNLLIVHNYCEIQGNIDLIKKWIGGYERMTPKIMEYWNGLIQTLKFAQTDSLKKFEEE